jgi:hypothetical protein
LKITTSLGGGAEIEEPGGDDAIDIEDDVVGSAGTTGDERSIRKLTAMKYKQTTIGFLL